MAETLIVLVLVSGLAVLVTFQGQQHQARLAEQAFWPSWQRMWTMGRQQAIRRQQRVRVTVETARSEVILQVSATGQVLGKLKIPRTLQCRSGQLQWGIRPDGTGTAMTIEWYSTASHRWLYQTFQLGGAIFYVENEATQRLPQRLANS